MNLPNLKEAAVSYALSNGLLHGEIIDGKQYYTHMPISLFPFVLPRKNYLIGEELNNLFDELVVRISNRPEWLFEQLKDVTDDFTSHLIDIAKEAIKSPFYQPIGLGIMRSDYMIDKSNPSGFLQIELNTISCSFVGVEEKLSQLHHYVLSTNKEQFAEIAKFMEVSEDDLNSYVEKDICNDTCKKTTQSLADAVQVYNSLFHTTNTCVLIVNQENENNNVDQFLLSTRLNQHYHISCLYQTHTELAESMKVENGCLRVNGHEVAVVYYRSGYTPLDYPTSLQWNVRRELELSRAIKCPSIVLHLTGCKKIQQQLCIPGVVEELFDQDVQKSDVLRKCFVPMYPADEVIDNESLMKEVELHPDQFVLKPQREGGGFNIWNEEIVKTLKREDKNELASLILMRRIFPQETQVYHIKERNMELKSSLSEIGFYSSVLFNSHKKEIIKADTIGVLVRTKVASSNEGGVSAGFAVMNSPLVTSELCIVCFSRNFIKRKNSKKNEMASKKIPEVTDDELRTARIYYISGFFFLPMVWLLVVLNWWKYRKSTSEKGKRMASYVNKCFIGCIVWTAILLIWIIVFQVSWKTVPFFQSLQMAAPEGMAWQ